MKEKEVSGLGIGSICTITHGRQAELIRTWKACNGQNRYDFRYCDTKREICKTAREVQKIVVIK